MSNRDYVLRAAQQQITNTISMVEESLGICEAFDVGMILARAHQDIGKMFPPRTFIAGGAEQRKAAGGLR